jgi:cytochrome c oxidase cbb3-type subunit 3
MIPWRGTINPEQIVQVSSYITTLQGTNPPNAKAPQGDLVEM